MAIASASTSLLAATGFLISCVAWPNVLPMSAFFSAISSASKAHPPSSYFRCCPLERSVWERHGDLFCVCRPALWDHANAMLGTQRNRREDFDGMSWDNFEMIFLLNYGQQQRSFHHREGCADTNSWPASKGEIRETRNLS